MLMFVVELRALWPAITLHTPSIAPTIHFLWILSGASPLHRVQELQCDHPDLEKKIYIYIIMYNFLKSMIFFILKKTMWPL